MSQDQASLTSKIAVVGAGEVGSTIAYSLILNPVAGDILLIDPDTSRRDAQAQDLSDATYHGNTSTRVLTAEPEEAAQCDVIVLTAGAAQKKGESRTDLIGKNVKILKSAIEGFKGSLSSDSKTILLVVANPVDVFGSGTFLDSARLRGILASRSGVAASSIDAYVLGEHGDSQMVAWSHVSIGGVPLDQAVGKNEIDKKSISEETKKKAAAIMEAKGATAYGIGGVAASLCKSILFDQRNVRPVSHWQEELGVCLSMPAVIGRKGIVRTLPMDLSDQEKRELETSAKSLKEVVQEAEKSQQ
ncbi:hypothetical protein LTR05_003275 [Lithohypha guttulata]|uniref:L-lactate dehydrogenase n=1 Tax=Lithohypha guttulata TaxID=1690604 RepID=A0AAN7T3J7_9EURO|nr:hypothetical protein LTR05_003275 [Lithohypha guttulata]